MALANDEVVNHLAVAKAATAPKSDEGPATWMNRSGCGGDFWPWKRGWSHADRTDAGKPTTRRYSQEEKAAAVRMVRSLRAELGHDHGTASCCDPAG